MTSLLLASRLAAQPTPTATNDLTELSLEDLSSIRVTTVYGASKYEQKTKEAPSAVTIVDSEEIKKYGHRTLADILRSVNGLYVSYDRNYSYLGIRGFGRPGDYNSRVLLLVDGHRINDNVFDSAFIGTEFPLDVDMIERVEVVRGPSFSVFGDNAVFAVINVVTRHGRDINGAEASFEAGSFDSYKGNFSAGKKFKNDLELALSGSFYDSAGPGTLYYPSYNTVSNNVNNGVMRHTDYDSAHKFIATLTYHDFTIQGLYGSREKGIPTGSYGTTFNDPRAQTTDTRAYFDVTYRHKFENDSEVTARGYVDHYDYQGIYPYAPTLNHDQVDGNSWGAELQYTKKINDRHTLMAGVEFHDNFQQDQQNYDDAPRAIIVDARHHSESFGAYAQGDFALCDRLILSTGVRYDHFSTFGDTVNPRAGLIFNPWQSTTVKLLYGTAFRAPNAYELYYVGPGQKANPGLKPEDVTTYQIVLEQELPHHLRATLTGYRYEMDKLINQQIDPADGLVVYQNTEQAVANGLEAGLEGNFAGGLRGRLSYAIQRTTDSVTGAELSNSPRHLAKFNLIVPLYRDRLFTGVEVQYESRTTTFMGNRNDGFCLVNWTLFSQKLVKGLEISASLYNLFDESYSYTAAGEHIEDTIPQDGRTFRVKLTYRY